MTQQLTPVVHCMVPFYTKSPIGEQAGSHMRLLAYIRDVRSTTGRYALPNGLLGETESAEQAAVRITRELTGLPTAPLQWRPTLTMRHDTGYLMVFCVLHKDLEPQALDTLKSDLPEVRGYELLAWNSAVCPAQKPAVDEFFLRLASGEHV